MPLRKSVSMEEHQNRASRRDNYFIHRIQVVGKLSKKEAKAYLKQYKRLSMIERRSIRETINTQYEAIVYKDEHEETKRVFYIPKLPKTPTNLMQKKNWFSDWLSYKAIFKTESGYNRPLSKYEQRIISGHEKYPDATLTKLRGH